MNENIEICKASEWSSWGDCSKPCGGGVQYSTRYPMHEEYNEYDCGSLTQTRECNTQKCPVPLITFFKHIDYKENRFIGWSEDEVSSACETKKNILKTSDSFVLYYDAEYELSVGLFVEPASDSEFFENFTISASGEFVYANGKFIKVKGREITEILECDMSSHENITEKQNVEWCGEKFTKDSFICIKGIRETGGVLNQNVADRYYYNQTTSAFKTEWMSRNNLLKIVYISASDTRNKFIRRNTWSVVDNNNNILYYTIEFDEANSCPPLNASWIPVYPMVSNNLSLVNDCDSSPESVMSCDLKDAYAAGWFANESEGDYSNIFEKNLVNHSDVSEVKNDFNQIIERGSGLPRNESNVFQQSFRGHFNINSLVSNPKGVGVTEYFNDDEDGGDILHKIEVPFNLPIDLVNIKLMSKLNLPGHFHTQAFSIKTQKWVHLETINHFSNNQQIVTDIKNDNYDNQRPPVDGSDIILESVVALRFLFGEYDYDKQEASALQLNEVGQGMMIHSLRVEGHDAKKCRASEVSILTAYEVQQIVKEAKREKPKLYESFTEIVGDLCVGNILYGNYKYEGTVDELYYKWSVNDNNVANTRHFDTTGLSTGSNIKFEVTFVYDEGKRTTFETTETITNCKTKVYPPFDNFANFIYDELTTESSLLGFDWPDVACATTNTNYIKFYWRGNLEVGKQISTESDYQSTEKINPGRQYFLCKEENCVIKLSKQLAVVEIISCPPSNFDLVLDKNFAINSSITEGSLVGKLVGSPINKNIKYNINNNAFGIHNNLFKLTGGDPVNNLQNLNLVIDGDLSDIGTEAKISIRASNHTGIGIVEKNFTLNIIKSELQRYADCPRVSVTGFECDFMNGNYGLIYHSTLSSSHEMGYAYYNKKLLYRTPRKFTSGFILLDGTVEFGSGYVYSEIRWENTKNRWELYVYSDDEPSGDKYNESYVSGKLCAYSTSYSTSCPVELEFAGISESFGNGTSVATTLIDFGDDFNTDCIERNIC